MMTIRLFLIAALLYGPTRPFAGATELAAEDRGGIEGVLEITGAAALSKPMAIAATAQFARAINQARPDIPQRVLDILPAEVEHVFTTHMGSFMDSMIPVYHKYYTGKEIKELIRFYSTDLGRKTIRVMPALLNESLQVGQEWGKSLGPVIEQRIAARLKQEGIKP